MAKDVSIPSSNDPLLPVALPAVKQVRQTTIHREQKRHGPSGER